MCYRLRNKRKDLYDTTVNTALVVVTFGLSPVKSILSMSQCLHRSCLQGVDLFTCVELLSAPGFSPPTTDVLALGQVYVLNVSPMTARYIVCYCGRYAVTCVGETRETRPVCVCMCVCVLHEELRFGVAFSAALAGGGIDLAKCVTRIAFQRL